MAEEDAHSPVAVDGAHAAPTKPKPRPSGSKSKGKKGAFAGSDDAKFEFGDIVLARLRGFPPWPARITDPEILPANVLAQRPKSNLFYCTQFFPAGDFSWLPPREIQSLKPHQIDAFLNESHRKSAGQLREAYETARDPTEWDAAQEDAIRAQEEANEDVDELEDEEEGTAQKGKRKRAPAPAKKEAKKPKTAPAKKAAEPSKAKAADKPKPKPAKETKGAPDGDEDPMAQNPEAIKIKDWRHKLQRAFLSTTPMPKPSEMDQYDAILTTIENYTDMRVEYLLYSKIHKVMRRIAALDTIPRNDELHITNRASKLANQMGLVIETCKPNGKGKVSASDAPAPTSVSAAPAPEAAPETAPEASAETPSVVEGGEAAQASVVVPPADAPAEPVDVPAAEKVEVEVEAEVEAAAPADAAPVAAPVAAPDAESVAEPVVEPVVEPVADKTEA